MRDRILLLLIGFVALAGCRSTKEAFRPEKKYAPDVLQRDYRIYRTVLEEHHAGLYWYTPKARIDSFFDWGFSQLKDSLSEPAFRKILTYITAQIQCGHTTVRWSKRWGEYTDTTKKLVLFPLSIKLIGERAVITGNLHRKDSILTAGTELLSINERTVPQLIDTLGKYISRDGGNQTARAQWLSNRGNFGSIYRLVFGEDSSYAISYLDKEGIAKRKIINVFAPSLDTTGRATLTEPLKKKNPSRATVRKENRDRVRQLQIDTLNHSAMMRLASFGKGYQLSSFFRNSFKELAKNKIQSLIIDVRNNGGGIIRNATLLTRYITDSSFKIADSLYAKRMVGSQDGHMRFMLWYQAAMFFATHKKKDGLHHFVYYEKHRFFPRNNYHFGGKVYIITGGNSFSATTIFASKLSGQSRITIVGEETGGAAYGNSAWMMPDLILPGTNLVVRIPLYRFVMDQHQPHNGSGVQPTIPAVPTIKSIRENKDVKMEAVLELIKQAKQKRAS